MARLKIEHRPQNLRAGRMICCGSYSSPIAKFLKLQVTAIFRICTVERQSPPVLELTYKRTGGRGRMSKCLKFCTGLKFKTDFHSKISVCTNMNWWGLNPKGGLTPPPDSSNTGTHSPRYNSTELISRWSTRFDVPSLDGATVSDAEELSDGLTSSSTLSAAAAALMPSLQQPRPAFGRVIDM